MLARRPAGVAAAAAAVALLLPGASLKQLVLAKKLAERMGGVNQARQALDLLAKLLD